MKKFVGVCISAVAVIGLSSCGGDGMGSNGAKKKLTEALLETAAESDTTIDEACVAKVVKQLNKDDLTLLVDNLDALIEGSADISTLEISEEGFATFMTISDCITAE
jgi:hypothetical protein